MNRGQKVVLGVALVGGTALGISALSKGAKAAPPPVVPPSLVEGYLSDIAACLTLDALAAVKTRFDADYTAGKLTQAEYQQVYDAYVVRYNELSAVTTALDIRFQMPDAFMPAPSVTVDGAVVGTAPLLWQTSPGPHTVSWQDKPGGLNPTPGVAYYQAPPPQTVTVTEGQTLMVTGIYTIVPTSPPDIRLDAFNFGDAQPFLPSSTHIAYINITNPTDRTIQYLVYAYPSDPGDTGEPASLGSSDLGLIPPGSWSTQFSIQMPAAAGTYPIWLRFYEWKSGGLQTFIKRVNTGQSVTVAPSPSQWPIQTQLASIMPYLVLAGVWRYSLYWTYQPANPGATNLFELFVGETVEINVTQPCTLMYSGWTWSLAAGYNTITWGSPPPPPSAAWLIETQLASIMIYLKDAWVFRSGTWYLYVAYNRPASNLQEIYPGETVYIEVLQNCVLSYGGKTWNLAAGENTITW